MNTITMNIIQPTIFMNKIIKLQSIVENVIRSNQIYKALGYIEANDLNSCVIYAESIYLKLNSELLSLEENSVQSEDARINALQAIITEISTLISLYGCDTLANLLMICIGPKFIIEDKYLSRYKLLNSYIKQHSYYVISVEFLRILSLFAGKSLFSADDAPGSILSHPLYWLFDLSGHSCPNNYPFPVNAKL